MCVNGPYSAEYLGSVEGLRIFRRRKVAGPTSSGVVKGRGRMAAGRSLRAAPVKRAAESYSCPAFLYFFPSISLALVVSACLNIVHFCTSVAYCSNWNMLLFPISNRGRALCAAHKTKAATRARRSSQKILGD